jgi:hypothetical protein
MRTPNLSSLHLLSQNQSMVAEAARGLAMVDKANYFAILAHLGAIVSLGKRPPLSSAENSAS